MSKKGNSVEIHVDPSSGRDRTGYILVKPPDGKVWVTEYEYVEWDVYVKAINDYLKKAHSPIDIAFVDGTE